MLKYIFPVTVAITFLIACGEKHTTASNTRPQPGHKWQVDEEKPAMDPNVNNESQWFYNPSETKVTDILHTKLEVRFDWAKRYMYGKATIDARPYFYPESKMVLDARGMEIRRVGEIKSGTMGKNDTVSLKYDYDGKKLSIDLGRQMTRTDYIQLYIDYVSKPDELSVGGSAAITEDKGLYFINPDGKVPNKPKEIWTQGETQSNCVWMPTIDHPNEKMTQEFYITVEDKYKTLSNGILADAKENGDGTRTDHWRMDLPHSTYLAMMAIGEFSIVKDSWRGREVSYYVEPQFEPYARQIFGLTPEMIEFFSTKLGVDYAWPKYSQVCARDYVSGAMENTTATLHSDYLQRDDRELLDKTYEEYISHELFHQWFGDLVTCESWSNLPLNESFATYGEYMWDEYKHGKDEADYGHYESLQGYLAEAAAGPMSQLWPGKREPLIRFYYTDREDMFDSHSYNKGGQVLHLLRQYVGDDAFFASLKLYLETNKFGTGEVHDLRLAFEKTTGQDLNWFFNEWFLSPGHPELDIAYNYDATKLKERVIIKQVQDRSQGTPVFRIPLNVGIYVGGNHRTESIVVKSVADTFYFDAAQAPDLVNVDEQKTLPCYKYDHHTPEEWMYMFDHATCYVDKMEAMRALSPRYPEGEPATQVISKALKDPFWAIRYSACRKLASGRQADKNGTPPPMIDALKTQLVKLSKDDQKSLVRALALQALSENATGDDLKQTYLDALNDKSYYVISAGLEGLVVHFKETGMAEAKKREDDPARSMKLAVGNAYSVAGGDAQEPWFAKTLPTLWGSHQAIFIQQYAGLLRNCSPETVRKALPQFDNWYSGTDSPGTKRALRSALSNLSGYYNYKAEEDQKKIDELKSVKNNATGIAALEADKQTMMQLAQDVEEEKKRLK